MIKDHIHHPTERIAHTKAFVTPIVEHWLNWEITQGVYKVGSIRCHTTPSEDTLPLSYVPLRNSKKSNYC